MTDLIAIVVDDAGGTARGRRPLRAALPASLGGIFRRFAFRSGAQSVPKRPETTPRSHAAGRLSTRVAKPS
jgi:hypothetical protein